MSLLTSPAEFTILVIAWLAILVPLSLRKGYAIFSVLLFAFVFFDFFSFRFPFRTEEFFTYTVTSGIMQTGHIPNLWESSWPAIFEVVSSLGESTGMSPLLSSEIFRILAPAVVAIFVTALIGRVWPGFRPIVVIVSLLGSYGLSDIYPLTPAYFGIMTTFFFAFVILRWMDNPTQSNLIVAVVAILVAMLTHPFTMIYISGITLAITLFSFVRYRVRNLPILWLVILTTTSYDIFYVENFRTYLVSGLQQALGFLSNFELGATDRQYIASHIASQPPWSVQIVYFWVALSAMGVITAFVMFLRFHSPRWFLILGGLGVGLILIQLLQSSQSGIALAVLTYLSPIAIATLMAAVFRRARSPRVIRSLVLILAAVILIGTVPSFLTYNSQVYTQSVLSSGVQSVSYLRATGTSLTEVYGYYPGLVIAQAPFVFTSNYTPLGLQEYVNSFLKSRNTIFYTSIHKLYLGEEFLGVNSTFLSNLVYKVNGVDVVYGSSGVAVSYMP